MVIDRRMFLLASLAGLASPAPAPQGFSGDAVTRSGDDQFDAWSRGFVARAVAAGWPEALLRRELEGLTPDAEVIAADRRQPEFTRPVGDYIASAASPDRVAEGQAELKALAGPLDAIESRYQVDRHVLVAVWGLESAFGTIQGDHDVVRSLATLAADGRRRDWAEAELFAALRIIATGLAARAQLKGSWAGALGQTQFMPSSYLRLAVDADGDGKADIWASAADALGSAANLLHDAGWTAGQDWAREVRLPASGFDYGQSEEAARAPGDWAARGVTRADGRPWPEADASTPAVLLLPAGAAGPAFLAFPNHFVIRRYNNSVSYALAVGLLADALMGRPPLLAAWPQEQPLSRDQQLAAQSALKALGFDPGEPDGVFGTRSRAALKAWQQARGLPADGHLTVELSARLGVEAGLVAPAPGAPGQKAALP